MLSALMVLFYVYIIWRHPVFRRYMIRLTIYLETHERGGV